MPIFSGEWSGIPNVFITLILGIVLVTIASVIAYQMNVRFALKETSSKNQIPKDTVFKFTMVGLVVALYMMVTFTSAKNCSLIIAGKEYFIIAGSLMYPVLAYGLDIIDEFLGKKYAKISVHVQLLSRILVTIYLLWIIYLPAPTGETENFIMFRDLMGILPRVTVASVIANYISSLLDISIFSRIREATYDKNQKRARKLWMRSSVSSFVSLSFNVAMFSFIAFVGSRPIIQIFQTIIFSMLVRFIMSLLEIPFLYLLRWLGMKGVFVNSYEETV
ncbi:MAG: queuosine precursor transporter [Oscillospiraceae bacterium]|jgi:uncharacterized integral membrane protein (TIGR00697 family)|nr:queuosine precursor transporter [Oscillospiraceae bacterium]